MRSVTFTEAQFNTFVFRQCALATAENESEFETGLRLIKKFKDPALTVPEELTDAEKEQQKKGNPVFPYYRLREPKATFLLEEDEWQLALKRLRANRTRVATLVAEEFAELLKAVAEAPEFKPTAPVVENGERAEAEK